jgi:hypothetical protein
MERPLSRVFFAALCLVLVTSLPASVTADGNNEHISRDELTRPTADPAAENEGSDFAEANGPSLKQDVLQSE